MVPFPWPVVPEVKAMRAVSSAAVSRLANQVGLPAIMDSSEPGWALWNCTTRAPSRRKPEAVVDMACSQSAATRASVKARRIFAVSAM